jgi:hypothetical protein
MIYVISKLTVQETIDRISVMLETPKKNWQMEKIISFFFRLLPPSCIQTYRRKRLSNVHSTVEQMNT